MSGDLALPPGQVAVTRMAYDFGNTDERPYRAEDRRSTIDHVKTANDFHISLEQPGPLPPPARPEAAELIARRVLLLLVLSVISLVAAGVVAVTRTGGGGEAEVRTGPEDVVTPGAGPTLAAQAAPPVDSTLPMPLKTAPPASAPATTSPACRNSSDPACGPFRFDPQPAADHAMTVEVAAPMVARVGDHVLFTIGLRDPDGVSYAGELFMFGDRTGIGASSVTSCDRYGPWDPPTIGGTPESETREVRHTYDAVGSYTATFAFDAGPFDCVDSVSGRGDRPYATSAVGSATVVITP